MECERGLDTQHPCQPPGLRLQKLALAVSANKSTHPSGRKARFLCSTWNLSNRYGNWSAAGGWNKSGVFRVQPPLLILFQPLSPLSGG